MRALPESSMPRHVHAAFGHGELHDLDDFFARDPAEEPPNVREVLRVDGDRAPADRACR